MIVATIEGDDTTALKSVENDIMLIKMLVKIITTNILKQHLTIPSAQPN